MTGTDVSGRDGDAGTPGGPGRGRHRPPTVTWEELSADSCRDARVAGKPLAWLATGARAVGVPETRWAAATARMWLELSAADVEEGVRTVADAAVSVRSWTRDQEGNTRKLGPSLNNLDPSTLAETLVELAVLALRTSGPATVCVMAVQRFVALDATVLARVDPTDRTVVLRVCWGLAEWLGHALHFDEWLVHEGDQVADRRISLKPTATFPVLGGTDTVDVTPHLRKQPVLGAGRIRSFSMDALAVAAALERPCEVTFGLSTGRGLLLSCTSVEPAPS